MLAVSIYYLVDMIQVTCCISFISQGQGIVVLNFYWRKILVYKGTFSFNRQEETFRKEKA